MGSREARGRETGRLNSEPVRETESSERTGERQRERDRQTETERDRERDSHIDRDREKETQRIRLTYTHTCLLYTSDAADDC